MTKAIIFDVDGVVVNSVEESGNFLWQASIEKDLGITKVHLRKIFEKANWEKITRGVADTKEYLQEVFKDDDFKNLKLSPELFIDYWLAKDSNINYEFLELVKSLSLPCYLGTNQEKYRTNNITKSVGNYFAGIFSSYQIGSIKPEPEFYLHIQNKLNLKPEELFFIDDTKENVTAASELGWKTYHYQNDLENLRKILCKY